MWVLALPAGFVAFILFVPVRFCLRLTGPGLWMAELSLAGWLGVGWSGAGRYLFAGRLRRPLGPGRPAAGEWRRELWPFASAERRQALGRLAAAMWAATTFSASGAVRYGFADPALTAWVHSLVCAWGPRAGFTAEPDFTREGLEGHMAAACSLRPVRIIRPLVGFLSACRRRKQGKGGKKAWQVQT